MYKIKSEVDLIDIIKVLKSTQEKAPKGFRNVLKSTASNIAKDAQDNIRKNSYKTGKLYRSVGITYGKQGTRAIIEAKSKHGSFIENGTRAHTIIPNSKKVLRFNSGGKFVFTKKVRHPGTKAKPFMDPAFNKNIPYFIKRLEDVASGDYK